MWLYIVAMYMFWYALVLPQVHICRCFDKCVCLSMGWIVVLAMVPLKSFTIDLWLCVDTNLIIKIIVGRALSWCPSQVYECSALDSNEVYEFTSGQNP